MPKVIFRGGPDGERTVEARVGQTLLDLAEDNDVKMGSACGGVCGCSSCHCYLVEGEDSLEEASDAEEDRLDMGFDVRPNSRLGCQVKVGEEDLVVELTQETVEVWFNEHPDARPES
ncbi:2Fe-2S iron-sulfur cluster binding domain-containing protein [Pseudenhygromyxa sp. WMMC2535]|uniref:2Fe-2S iron-sulfur cluster-binding protein n=1 Tax=Pseudenhygromyxa sp. WMMC2535 TaxID=2712867 RepID=UPI001552B190|nr:2Fe-2S iron-sulfur cluster-binding protein [Pseudenhygromyxa sp. WMMC2535]NVB36577.1 2Fe-2S iron-sulfur cluster binding domain-containing protein [Pseudenhygromyxa sp. WMMC2535]